MADYLEKLKSEYPGVFGPVAASDYTTLAGMGDSVDYILDYWKDKGEEGVKFLKDFAFEHMTSPEVKGYIERSKERGEDLEKKRDEFSDALKGYMDRSEKDALEKAKEYRDGKLKIGFSTGEDPYAAVRADPTAISILPSEGDSDYTKFMDGRLLPFSEMPVHRPDEMTDDEIDDLISEGLDLSADDPLLSGYTPGIGPDALPETVTAMIDADMEAGIHPEFASLGADVLSTPISAADLLEGIKSGTDPTFDMMKEGGWGADGLAALGAIPGAAILGGGLGALGGIISRGTGIHKALTGSRIPGTAGTVDEYARAKAVTAAGDDARLAAGEFAFPVGERSAVSWLAGVPVLGPMSKWVKEVFTRDVDVLSSMGMLTREGKISSTAERELVSRVAREVYGESTLATRAAVKKRLADELPDHDLSGVPGTAVSKATDYFSAMAKSAMIGKTATEYGRTVPKSTLDDFVGPGKLKAGEEMVGSGVDAAFRRGMGDVAEDMYGKMSTSAIKGGALGTIGGIGVGGAFDAEAATIPSIPLGAGSLGGGLATTSTPISSSSYIEGEIDSPRIPAAHHGPVWPITTEMPIDATGAPIEVDDFSSIPIPPRTALFDAGPAYVPDPRSPSLSYDFSGFGDPKIKWYWPDGRVDVITEEMVKEGWEKYTPAAKAARKAREEKEDAVAEALERMASLPPVLLVAHQ